MPNRKGNTMFIQSLVEHNRNSQVFLTQDTINIFDSLYFVTTIHCIHFH